MVNKPRYGTSILRRLYPEWLEQRELRRNLDALAAVNVVDKETDGDVGGREELSYPSEFPAGELPDNQNDAAEGLYHMPRQAEIGQELTQLTTERETSKPNQQNTQHGLWNKSYSDDNSFEDADLKLGESNDDVDPLEQPVYEPYAQGTGPLDSRYEDPGKKYDIVLHSTRDEEEIDPNKGPEGLWICVDLDGTLLSKPDEYQDENGMQLFGDPLPGAIEAMEELVAGEARVSIYTARQYFAEDEDDLRMQVQNELDMVGILHTDVYIGEKPPAHFFVDDRTIPPFEGDWDLVLDTVRDQLNKKSARRKVTARAQGGEKRTYEVEGHPDVIKRLDLMLEAMSSMGGAGCSRGIVLSMDGDGPEFLYVEGTEYELDGESYEKELNGNDVHVYSLKSVDEIEKKEANDPVKDIVNYQGIDIDVEWPSGSIRSYEGADTYVTHMKSDYGYARGVEGNDGEELDIYLVDRESPSPVAFIIEQLTEEGDYDEDKIVLGVESAGEAADIYLQHMPNYMLGDIREVPVEKLVNALYGKPEDRRGEEDLVPSEEKTAIKKSAGFKYMADKQPGEKVGLFIPLPPELAKQYPPEGKAGEDDSDPHLTLLYIGDVPEERWQELTGIIEESLNGVSTFELSLLPPDVFTNKEGQQIIHSSAEITAGDIDLSEIHNLLRRNIEDAGFEVKAHKDFTPHITIEYVNPDEDPKFADVEPTGSWAVDAIEIWGLGDPIAVGLNKRAAMVQKVAAYSDLAIEAIDKANISPLAQLILQHTSPDAEYATMVDELVRAMLRDKSLKEQIEQQLGRRPELDYPDYEPKQIDEAIGPSGTQKIVQAVIKRGTKTWPGDDLFENEYTDGMEDRENRDIPRPESTEKATYVSLKEDGSCD